MTLRNHFRPPVSEFTTSDGLFGGWPAVIVQHLRHSLPPGFIAAPRVHLGKQIEGEVATAVWAPVVPSVDVETDLPEQDTYEVQIYNIESGRRLVAAIELVSPANKDRPEHRSVFVGKCAALLQQGVSVSIVDLITPRHFNLYADLLHMIGHEDSTYATRTPYLYAASCRWVERESSFRFQTWSHKLIIGQPLPTLPLWLSPDLPFPLALEVSYERTCDDLWIA